MKDIGACNACGDFWKDCLAFGTCILVGIASGILLTHFVLDIVAVEDRDCVCECGDLTIGAP